MTDTFKTFVGQLTDLIGGAIAGLFMTMATVAFLWTVVKFIMARSSGKDGKAMNDAKEQLGWSIIALFVMFSIWGIITFLQSNIFGGNATTTISAPSVKLNGTAKGGSSGVLL